MEGKHKVSIPLIEGYAERQTDGKVPEVKRISDIGEGTGSADVICVDDGCGMTTRKITSRNHPECYSEQHEEETCDPEGQSARPVEKILKRNGDSGGCDVDKLPVFKNEFGYFVAHYCDSRKISLV